MLEPSLYRIGLSQSSTTLPSFLSAHGLAEVVLATVLVTVVAISEETIFRGYLILRLSPLLTALWQPCFFLLPSVIFALGHGYEGSAGAVSVGVMSFVFAVVYLWRGSLLGPLVMHFREDFIRDRSDTPTPSQMSRKVVSRVDCWVSLELAASEAARPWGLLGRICFVAAGKRPFFHQHLSFAYCVCRTGEAGSR